MEIENGLMLAIFLVVVLTGLFLFYILCSPERKEKEKEPEIKEKEKEPEIKEVRYEFVFVGGESVEFTQEEMGTTIITGYTGNIMDVFETGNTVINPANILYIQKIQ